MGARAVLAEGKIYVVGGHTRSVEFIPKNGERTGWTVMKPALNTVRIGLGLAWFDGGLFAIGGNQSKYSSIESLEAANPKGVWKTRKADDSRDLACGIHSSFFGDLVILTSHI